jgi:hypothetical protein
MMRFAELYETDADPIAKFSKLYYDHTQVHPFDDAARISRDGKSIATLRSMGSGANAYVYLDSIQTLAPEARTGSSSALLRLITNISDMTGVPIHLDAKPYGTTPGKLNKRQLIAWYKRNGFEGSGDKLVYNPYKMENKQMRSSEFMAEKLPLTEDIATLTALATHAGGLVAQGILTKQEGWMLFAFLMSLPFVATGGFIAMMEWENIKYAVQDMIRDWKETGEISPDSVQEVIHWGEEYINGIESKGERNYFVGLLNKYKNTDITDKKALIQLQRELKKYYEKLENIKRMKEIQAERSEIDEMYMDAMKKATKVGIKNQLKSLYRKTRGDYKQYLSKGRDTDEVEAAAKAASAAARKALEDYIDKHGLR